MLQSLYYLTDTTTLFSVYDMATVSIRVFDLNKDQLKFTIPCEKAVEKTEYPDRIGGYYIHNRDSIFILSFFSNEISLINTHGDILSKATIPILREDSLPYRLKAYDTYPYFRNGKVFLRQNFSCYNYASDTIETILFYNTPVEAIVDFSTGKIIATNIKYPPLYRKGIYYNDINPNRAINHSSGVRYYTFGYSDSVISINGKSNARKVYSYSNYLKDPQPFEGDSASNYNYIQTYRIKNAISLDLHYDQFRSKLYRIIKHRAPLTNERGKTSEGDEPMSIVVIDNNLQTIGEQYFEGGFYISQIPQLITKDGLAIFLHPDHPDYEEGKWNFALLKPEGND